MFCTEHSRSTIVGGRRLFDVLSILYLYYNLLFKTKI